jgi:hypothetical protein
MPCHGLVSPVKNAGILRETVQEFHAAPAGNAALEMGLKLVGISLDMPCHGLVVCFAAALLTLVAPCWCQLSSLNLRICSETVGCPQGHTELFCYGCYVGVEWCGHSTTAPPKGIAIKRGGWMGSGHLGRRSKGMFCGYTESLATWGPPDDCFEFACFKAIIYLSIYCTSILL